MSSAELYKTEGETCTDGATFIKRLDHVTLVERFRLLLQSERRNLARIGRTIILKLNDPFADISRTGVFRMLQYIWQLSESTRWREDLVMLGLMYCLAYMLYFNVRLTDKTLDEIQPPIALQRFFNSRLKGEQGLVEQQVILRLHEIFNVACRTRSPAPEELMDHLDDLLRAVGQFGNVYKGDREMWDRALRNREMLYSLWYQVMSRLEDGQDHWISLQDIATEMQELERERKDDTSTSGNRNVVRLSHEIDKQPTAKVSVKPAKKWRKKSFLESWWKSLSLKKRAKMGDQAIVEEDEAESGD